jgi:ribonuclease-3
LTAVNATSLSKIQKRLGYEFRNPALLVLSLTHPSVAHELNKNIETNQRLEFLGDAVLQLILTHDLYGRFQKHGEGPLTKARATLVNRRMLAIHGRNLELEQYLIVSHGEAQSGGHQRPSALADAFEALIGAIFVDGGLEPARAFVLREFAPFLSSLDSLPLSDNPKGDLQELLQADASEPPQYQLLTATGPDHDRNFECSVSHRGVELGRGTGKSKKDAEANAALVAYQRLKTSKPKVS